MNNSAASSLALAPANMARVGTVDDRYQSYNVEMLEVTGGKFWKPYGPELEAILREPKSAAPQTPAKSGEDTPAGMDPRLYQYRPPIDLTNARLRKLAQALAPTYVRVSGTWANTTYFPDTDQAPANPPPGFMGVLTRQQWKGLVDFANAVDARIVTSFSTGVGTRDASGVWTPKQAQRLLDYTRSIGGSIAAAEFMNEPTIAAMGGAPAGYTAAAYGRDFKVFHAFAKQTVPDMLILGPGSVGETSGDWGVSYGIASVLKTRDLLAASQPDLLGRLAKQEVRVIAHNTLVASDYGLLDDQTLDPKPNYWGALLWRKLMGTSVLESGIPIQAGQHVYAHCLRGTPGGVALLVINTDQSAARTLSIPVAGERYTLSSSDPQSRKVQLNGTELKLGAGDALPILSGAPLQAGNVEFAPATITFVALSRAGNGACQ